MVVISIGSYQIIMMGKQEQWQKPVLLIASQSSQDNNSQVLVKQFREMRFHLIIYIIKF